MADIVAATLHAQFGKETVAGTAVAASKQMKSFGLARWKPMGSGQMLTPQGILLPTTMVPVGRRWMETTFDGVLDYNELTYILNSLLIQASPAADGTNGKRWTYTPSYASVDTRDYFTIEQGNNQHAQKSSYCFFNSGKVEMTPLMQKISGNIMGQMFTDDITLTASPTLLAAQVINPAGFDVRIASTYAALVGTAQVETATAAGTVSGAGNASVTVTGAGITGSPVVLAVAVANSDTPSLWGPKVVTAINGNAAINALYTASSNGGGAGIVLTARTPAANDGTLNIALATGTATGITAAPASADTTAGVAPATVYSRPFGVTLDIPNVQDVISRMNSADTSFISSIGIPYSPIATFRTDADDAGMAYLSTWSGGTAAFISVTVAGGAIAGAQASAYGFQLIFSGIIPTGYNPVDDHGNAQAEWPLHAVVDGTWGNALQIVLTNSLAAL